MRNVFKRLNNIRRKQLYNWLIESNFKASFRILENKFKKMSLNSEDICRTNDKVPFMMAAACKKEGLNISNRPLRVSIEGNIGCGKSTLIKYFKNFEDIDTKAEPLSSWRDVQGHNLLHLTYADPKRWNFTFQHFVQLSRLNLQTSKTDKKIQLFERSLQNNRYCFVEMAYEGGLLKQPEYITLCEWYDWIENNIDISLDLIVYLRSSPTVVYNRMQQRNRPEESTISFDYLANLHRHYEMWLMECDPSTLPAPVLVLDVDKDLKHVTMMYSRLEQYLMERKSISCRRVQIGISNENEVCV